ncbi:MAG: hypothetical protein HQ581_10300 [Planctomycetes bacterium]|nr:hypothetical protein [Planctomycetota bacterium]
MFAAPILTLLGILGPACGAEVGKADDAGGCPQIDVPLIEKMPNIPKPLKMRDWKQVAKDFDELVFDFSAEGENFPLIWIDRSHINNDDDGFGIPTTIGDPRQGPGMFGGASHGAIDCIGSVLSATYVGIDKSDQHGLNFVRMCKNYYHTASGRDVVLYFTNDDVAFIGAGMQFDFWVDLLPNVLFFRLVHLYPDEQELTDIMRKCADQWCRANKIMDGNYKWSYFDFKEMKPKTSAVGEQPDAAAAIALIQLLAYKRFHDREYLEAAERALTWLDGEEQNWLYDVSMYYAPYVAARLNAEHDRTYNIDKMMNWVFTDGSDKWKGRRVVAERWGDCDAHGLSAVGNRAYAMETFEMAAPIVPIVRYDQRYARAVGKWMLNASNAARLFYGSELPDDHQSYPQYRGDVKRCIAYEAVQPRHGKPYFGDRDDWGNWDGMEIFAKHYGTEPMKFTDEPRASQFTLYGAAQVGVFGGIIRRTNHPAILQLDCLKTDVFCGDAYPTYLYFNPYEESKTVQIDVGSRPVDLYDTVCGKFVTRNANGKSSFALAADSAAVIVLTPHGSDVAFEGGKTLVNGVLVDYGSHRQN